MSSASDWPTIPSREGKSPSLMLTVHASSHAALRSFCTQLCELVSATHEPRDPTHSGHDVPPLISYMDYSGGGVTLWDFRLADGSMELVKAGGKHEAVDASRVNAYGKITG